MKIIDRVIFFGLIITCLLNPLGVHVIIMTSISAVCIGLIFLAHLQEARFGHIPAMIGTLLLGLVMSGILQLIILSPYAIR